MNRFLSIMGRSLVSTPTTQLVNSTVRGSTQQFKYAGSILSSHVSAPTFTLPTSDQLFNHQEMEVVMNKTSRKVLKKHRKKRFGNRQNMNRI